MQVLGTELTQVITFGSDAWLTNFLLFLIVLLPRNVLCIYNTDIFFYHKHIWFSQWDDPRMNLILSDLLACTCWAILLAPWDVVMMWHFNLMICQKNICFGHPGLFSYCDAEWGKIHSIIYWSKGWFTSWAEWSGTCSLKFMNYLFLWFSI